MTPLNPVDELTSRRKVRRRIPTAPSGGRKFDCMLKLSGLGFESTSAPREVGKDEP
jgi:hypothetical protein